MSPFDVRIKLLTEELSLKDKIISDQSTRHQELETKHFHLVSVLKDRLQCPVCLCLPTSGYLQPCRNGHIVCSYCRRQTCPVCRVDMEDIKSLLAMAVVEVIEHDCPNEGCTRTFLTCELAAHEVVCDHAPVFCPAPHCQAVLPLADLRSHLLTDCVNTRKELGTRGKRKSHMMIPDFDRARQLGLKDSLELLQEQEGRVREVQAKQARDMLATRRTGGEDVKVGQKGFLDYRNGEAGKGEESVECSTG